MSSWDGICWVVELGRIAYGSACELQTRLVQARKNGAIPDILLFCEHPHVITLGRNGKLYNLRASDRLLARMNVEFQKTDRGGDITYHGPGQLVAYPVLDLTTHRRDVRWYVAQLEEIMIRTTADFGISARRIEGLRGIWIDGPTGEEKLGALGVHLSRWVTSHGIAYNVNTDLRYFDLIVPCGIAGKRATSLERALGHSVAVAEVRERLVAHFASIFACVVKEISREDLMGSLAASSESFEHTHSAVT